MDGVWCECVIIYESQVVSFAYYPLCSYSVTTLLAFILFFRGIYFQAKRFWAVCHISHTFCVSFASQIWWQWRSREVFGPSL
jgi:hypothetical protein